MEKASNSQDLKIECEWWGSENADKDPSGACRGAIGITVGEHCLTELVDSFGETVRGRLHASAYPLAVWFAANWWRLRWEPETQSSLRDVDWLLSHSVASAGEGYSWPEILFASDGETLAVASRATQGQAMGPVRYLNNVYTRITAKAFESSVDTFLTFVLSRLDGQGHPASQLADLWAEVLEERRDPELTQWRRLEALCGYDPDEAPKSTIEMLVEDTAQLGAKALEEVAAHGRHETQGMVHSIAGLASSKARPAAGGFRARMPELKQRLKRSPTDRPWQRAAKLAQLARKEWDIGDGPVSNARLAELLGNKATIFNEGNKGAMPMPLLLRNADQDNVDVYLSRAHPTSCRFAASRLLGDSLLNSADERLIPATDAKTARQQFQRAFAQEFLCPYEALRARLETTMFDEDDIAEAATHFQVSTRVIETTLVNNGELYREALTWFQ